MSAPLAPPDVFGVANYANSPLPTIGTVTAPPTIVNDRESADRAAV
jgi:hypothetical protein